MSFGVGVCLAFLRLRLKTILCEFSAGVVTHIKRSASSWCIASHSRRLAWMLSLRGCLEADLVVRLRLAVGLEEEALVGY